MARSLNLWCPVSVASDGNLRGGLPNDKGCLKFLSFRSQELSGKTVSFSGRKRSLQCAKDTEVLQVQCKSTGDSGRNPRSTTEGQRNVLVAERRTDKQNNAELRSSRKAGQLGPFVGRRIHEDSVEGNALPEFKLPTWKSNSRHTNQTGSPREVSGHPEDGSRKSQAGSNLGSDSNLGCEHFSRCSGCSIENALDRPPVLRDAVQFFKSYGISDFSLKSGSLWEWRCRAKLAVRGTSENPVIGLYEEGSHISVDIPNCRTHHPRINAAVELVKEAIKALNIEPYDEESGSGHLRYIQNDKQEPPEPTDGGLSSVGQMVVSTHNTSLPAIERYANGKVQISLVWNTRDEKSAGATSLQPMAEFLWRKGGSRCPEPILHSVWVNFQTSRTNIIFGGKWRHLLGEQEMWERISGVDICLTPASFGQANLQAFEVLLRKLQTYVKRGGAVVELYAGVGVIGISLAAARACRSVKCVEVNKESRTSFQLSLSRVPDSVKSKISWHCADASLNPIFWLKGADTVVVDPPRKGLDPSVIEALRTASFRDQGKMKSLSSSAAAKVEKRPWIVRANQGVTKESPVSWDDATDVSWPNTLIYVSCGWQSFKKDCAALVENDAWHLTEAHAFNFFPGTDSIEVLAVFKSGKGSKQTKSTKKKKMGKRTPARQPASVSSGQR